MISSGNWLFHQHPDFPGEALQMSVSYRSYRAGRRNMPPSVEPLGCVACWKTSIWPPKKSFAEETSHSKLSLLGLRYVEFFCKGKHKWTFFGSPTVDILDWGTIFWKGLRTKYPGDQMWSHSILSNQCDPTLLELRSVSFEMDAVIYRHP